MADVVFHNKIDKGPSEENANDRINQIQVVYAFKVEILREKSLDEVYERFKDESGDGCEKTHKKTKDKNECLFLDVLFAPNDYFVNNVHFIA